MPVEQTPQGPMWRRFDRAQALRHWLWTLAMALVIGASAQAISAQTTWGFVWSASEQALDLGTRMMPPRLSYAPELWDPLWETLHTATLGTLLGVVLATPLAFLIARNTTPSVRVVRPLAMLLLVTSRSVNSLIWALLLVIIMGPGMLAGIIAIALRSVGFVGKLLFEAIEEIDPSAVEAVGATGASRLQTLAWAVVPQIAPAFTGISIYRWDINIREATVLGLVGAGGIGMHLQASIDTLAWSRVSVIFLAILGTVVLSEWVSARVRAQLI